MQMFFRFFQVVVVCVVAAYTFAYLLWRGLLISPFYEQFWQLQISEIFGAWFYLPLVPLLLLVLIGRRWKALTILLIPLAFFAWEYGPQFLPNWKNGSTTSVYAQTSDGSLRVLTWNSLGTHDANSELQRLLTATQPDLVTIQEARRGLHRKFERDLKDLYPYQEYQSYANLLTLSRHPLTKPQIDRLIQMGCRCQPLEMTWHGKQVMIINIHIPRPQVQYSVRRKMPRITAYNPQSQSLHYKVIFKFLDSIDGPILLQGDLNTTERQPNFHRLTERLQDSFAEAGWGMGFTYPNTDRFGPWWLIPLIQIDHIMHSQEFSAESANTGRLRSSDHLYVSTTLRWK